MHKQLHKKVKCINNYIGFTNNVKEFSLNYKNFCFKEESESEDEENVLEGPVTVRGPDDSLFEGNYSQGRPHGYFRQINSYGDLDFFGCFYRGTMLG